MIAFVGVYLIQLYQCTDMNQIMSTFCKPNETHKHNVWTYFTAVERFYDTLMSRSNCYEINDCNNVESECV